MIIRLVTICALSIGLLLASSTPAHALPRFAARGGNECIQCHVNPTGGGMRNSYGRNVFERVWLPFSVRPRGEDVQLELDGAIEAGWDEEALLGNKDDDKPFVSFSGDITDWLAIGGDIRVAYIWIRPDRGIEPGVERNITNSFFLMQADLYIGATATDHITFYLDLGVYSGFEAWGLYQLKPEPEDFDFMIKVGRFMPAFGIREVEHQLFTRERIGLGNADRDTGLELTAYVGPLTVNAALVNGTLGDSAFDGHGTERRRFEKAVVGRLSLRRDFGVLRAQVGGSIYWNNNIGQANPIFGSSIPDDLLVEVSTGLDELRWGAFATANIGPFTYLGDLVFVRDDFYSDQIGSLRGYASYQELSFLPVQGVELVTTFEFMDPDVELAGNSIIRAGWIVEFFPWPYTEFRVMVRRTWDDASLTGGAWDMVFFVHLFI
ncbi:MAG: hypothetical protein JRG93_00160 [Deltaproteobacteria bacterium]|nr:hypothetical protein [Deltaproteobacteria bacterium]MBW2222635.1 hypothetical protein [Deltaproteobacteria bacterium]MBW2402240.1 hypothetical protein [Deltaproteobacteria bacterium]MBW2545698.1 hypothetical protein [Deltaproteobacteria bacterium]MBW2717022.1 hypothetical protein [Deltaproteobacteria bacterium]